MGPSSTFSKTYGEPAAAVTPAVFASKSTEPGAVRKISTEPIRLNDSHDETDRHPDESAKHGLGSRLRRLSFKKKRTDKSLHLDPAHAIPLPDRVNGVPKQH